MRIWLSIIILFPLLAFAQESATILPADTIATQLTDTIQTRSHIETFKENAKEVIRKLDRFDHDYIEPDHYDWTVMLQNTNSFQRFSMSGHTANGDRQELSFNQRPSFRVGPYIGWRWIFLGYMVDVARPAKIGKSNNFNLSIYTNMIGADLLYQRNKGNYRLVNTKGFENISNHQFLHDNFPGLNTYLVSLSVYFILNHRRFSYPAAFNQSTRQKISAGSWMFGFRYDHQHISFDYTQLPYPIWDSNSNTGQLHESLRFNKYNYSDYSLSAGYAYNWVFAHNWLFDASVAPYLGFRKEKGEKQEANRLIEKFIRYVGLGVVARAGVVWNNGKGFVGVSFVSYDNFYHRRKLLVTNSLNYLNIYGGFYFRLKNKYRNQP